MKPALVAILLTLVAIASAADGTAVDMGGAHGGFSGRFDDWLVAANRVPGSGWLVLATTAEEAPVKLVDGFWQDVDREALPEGLAARIDDLLEVARLPLQERAAAMRERQGKGHELLAGGGAFSRGVAGKYMHYCTVGIGPHQREWVVVVGDFSAAIHQGTLVYSGPPETPAMREVLSQETCDAILDHIDEHRTRWDERTASFRQQAEAAAAAAKP